MKNLRKVLVLGVVLLPVLTEAADLYVPSQVYLPYKEKGWNFCK